MVRTLLILLFLSSEAATSQTWADKLGFPPNSKVLILQADDAGMCEEANEAISGLLEKKYIQNVSMMMPPAAHVTFANWLKANQQSTGLHITLTSEWRDVHWTALSSLHVPSLLNPQTFFWRSEKDFAKRAKIDEVEKEIRLQIKRAMASGLSLTHFDSHMGALFQSIELIDLFHRLAKEYSIPMLLVAPTKAVAKKLSSPPYEIPVSVLEHSKKLSGLHIDDYMFPHKATTYEKKLETSCQLLRHLSPGISEIVFHPTKESSQLKQMTGRWEQRVWENRLLRDPKFHQCIKEEGFILTSWKELKDRAVERKIYY